MVFTFLKAQGHEVGKSLLEEDQLDTCRGYLAAGRGAPASQIVLPTDIVVDTAFPSRRPRAAAGRRAGRRRSRPTASASTSAPSRPRPSPRRSPTPGRCSGTARWASSRSTPSPSGTRAVAAGADRDRRAVRRRRRRLRGRRAHARLRRGRVRPHLHRRRRQPRVPRGQGAARHRRPRRTDGRRARRRTPLMAGNWKMNLNHQEAVVLVQKLAWTLADKKHDYAQGRGRRAAAVHRPALACRRSSTATSCSIRYGAQDVSTARRRRLHRRDLGGDAGQARLLLRRRRPLRAPRVPRRDRRRRQRQGAQGARRRA